MSSAQRGLTLPVSKYSSKHPFRVLLSRSVEYLDAEVLTVDPLTLTICASPVLVLADGLPASQKPSQPIRKHQAQSAVVLLPNLVSKPKHKVTIRSRARNPVVEGLSILGIVLTNKKDARLEAVSDGVKVEDLDCLVGGHLVLRCGICHTPRIGHTR